MARPIRADLDFENAAKIHNLPDGTSAQDPATVAQLNAAVEGLAWKDSVRAASTANVTVSSAPSTLDSITLAANDRVLLKNQTTSSENGIYVYASTGAALVRAADANTANELEQAVTGVEEGSANADTTWRQTSVNFTLGSGSVTWEAFATAVPSASTSTAGKVQLAQASDVTTGTSTTLAVTPAALAGSSLILKKITGTIGDNSATSFTVDVSAINSRVFVVELYDAVTFKKIDADVTHTSATVLTVAFATAPASGGVVVVVVG